MSFLYLLRKKNYKRLFETSYLTKLLSALFNNTSKYWVTRSVSLTVIPVTGQLGRKNITEYKSQPGLTVTKHGLRNHL